jgi:hypothetical protein
MVRDAIEDVESNINEYIEVHSLVEVLKNEVLHGLEHSVSESTVEVNTPEMNTDSSYDRVRPNAGEIPEKLYRNTREKTHGNITAIVPWDESHL